MFAMSKDAFNYMNSACEATKYSDFSIKGAPYIKIQNNFTKGKCFILVPTNMANDKTALRIEH